MGVVRGATDLKCSVKKSFHSGVKLLSKLLLNSLIERPKRGSKLLDSLLQIDFIQTVGAQFGDKVLSFVKSCNLSVPACLCSNNAPATAALQLSESGI